MLPIFRFSVSLSICSYIPQTDRCSVDRTFSVLFFYTFVAVSFRLYTIPTLRSVGRPFIQFSKPAYLRPSASHTLFLRSSTTSSFRLSIFRFFSLSIFSCEAPALHLSIHPLFCLCILPALCPIVLPSLYVSVSTLFRSSVPLPLHNFKCLFSISLHNNAFAH